MDFCLPELHTCSPLESVTTTSKAVISMPFGSPSLGTMTENDGVLEATSTNGGCCCSVRSTNKRDGAGRLKAAEVIVVVISVHIIVVNECPVIADGVRTPLVLPAARAVRGGGRNAGHHAGPAPSVEPAFDYTSCACGCGLLHSLGVRDVMCGAVMQIRVICVSFVPQDGGRVHVQSEYN